MRALLLPILLAFILAPFAKSEQTHRTAPEMPLLKKASARDALISLDFNAVDIRVFIKTVGQLTGVNFLVDDKIQGTVTLISPSKIRTADVYAVLESVLQTKGYAAIPAGTLVKIVPRAEATRGNVPTQIGADPGAIPMDDSLITQIIPLRRVVNSRFERRAGRDFP